MEWFAAGAAAARGAMLLDKQRPGWWRDLDLAALRMHDCDVCVLGQLWHEEAVRANAAADDDDEMSGYEVGLEALFGERPVDGEPFNARVFGFTITPVKGDVEESLEMFRRLERAWVEEARRRREAA